ncbi:MAG: addiction module protein, partial [Candidatus Methylomirabilales bacterium]
VAWQQRVRQDRPLPKLPLPPPGFDNLPVEDRINYVQDLWDHIAAKPDQVPVPDWHRQVINERLAAYEADSDPQRAWEDVRDAIPSKLGGRKPER